MKREPLAEPAEVAEYLGVTEATLTNWRYLGRGPQWIKIERGRVRYHWHAVDAYVAAQAQGGRVA